MRGDESASRSEYKDVSLGEKVKGQYSCHPILEWGSAELFTYIYARDLIINEAYKKGNSRAGCLVCPLAASKNMYFKEQSYGKSETGELTTTTFNKIILDTTSKNLSSDEAVKEFMDIGGWKARRSGKELSIAKNLSIDEFEKGVLTITTYANATDWKEWIKTVGKVSFLTDGDVEVIFEGHVLKAIKIPEEYGFGTIRISFNHENTEEDAKYIAESIGKILTTVTKAKLKRS